MKLKSEELDPFNSLSLMGEDIRYGINQSQYSLKK
jgi:hypothetical protein